MAGENQSSNGRKRNAGDLDIDLSLSGGAYYEILVKGQLSNRWSEWLEGLEVKLLENGEMILFGPIVDQAALMGVLNKLSHLNLTLLSLNQVKKNRNSARAMRATHNDCHSERSEESGLRFTQNDISNKEKNNE